MKKINSNVELERFLDENDFSGRWSYITIGLDRLAFHNGTYAEVDYTTFIKDCLDNFNLMSFDFRLDGYDLFVCLAFENIADWKHFVTFCSDHNFEIKLYLIEEYYEI